MRLDYVSPLPPVRSGIADYSLDLLPHLAARVPVRIVRLPGQPLDPAIAERYGPVATDRLGEDGRLPLYQMGNNRHHRAVRELALERPGVLTLHDLVLHHLLLDVTLGEGLYEPYAEALRRDHGWLGEAVARPKRWGAYGRAAVFELPAHRTLLRRQRGILVHSRWAAERIGSEEPDLRVRAVPMGVPLPRPAGPQGSGAAATFRRRLGLPEAAPVLGSFGFQTPIKRTEAAIAALAAPGLEAVHLLVVGEVSEAVDLLGPARRAGVAGRVRLAGFVEFRELEAAIAAADLCLNLRYPTAGETSASLLRILAVGRPAIVSDYAQFAELPAGAVARVPLGDEEGPALAATLRELFGSPERLVAMGAAAREHVRREHDPERAAEAVVEACAAWEDGEPPGDARPTVAPPTSRAWGSLRGAVRVEGAGPPWPPGERRAIRITLENHGPATWLAADRGPGGIAVELRLEVDGGDPLAGHPWLALPRDLPAGDRVSFEVEVRRPPGAARLHVEPHLVGGGPLSELCGPSWGEEI